MFLLVAGNASAQSVPAAPTIDSVTAGDGLLTVAWIAPTGESGITAYDLRHIRTTEDETNDANWTLVEDVWTTGTSGLEHRILELEDIEYDVQVRAVRGDSDGTWSTTSTGTPADHGDTRSSATDLALNASVVGYIDSNSDDDYFQVTLSEESGIFVYTTSYITGFLGTTGELQDSGGSIIKTDDDDTLFRQHGQQLFLWSTLSAGTYYVKVEAPEAGYYTLHAEAVPDGSSKNEAVDLSLNGFADGILDPAASDEDWFKIDIAETTDLMLRVTRTNSSVDTEGTLFDSDDTELAFHDDSFLDDHLEKHFLIRKKLDAGVYYLRVRGSQGTSFQICAELDGCFQNSKGPAVSSGPYVVHAEAVSAPGGSTSSALALTLGPDHVAGGRIDSANDADYFKITVTETTHIKVWAISAGLETDMALLDTSRREVGTLQLEDDHVPGRLGGLLWGSIEPGTSYIKVTAVDTETGPYAIVAYQDTTYTEFVNGCSDIMTGYHDPLYGCQWHLNNTGQGGGTADEDINVEEVWADGNLGEGINIAVVDNGLYYDHEDLTTNVNRSLNHDYTGGGDVFGRFYTHGTRMAGIIAARDNNIGVRGVAPRATVYAYNLLRFPAFTISNLGDSMTRNMADTAVYNNSWGPVGSPRPAHVSTLWELAVDAGVSRGFGGKGVFYVFSVGNGGRNSTGDYAGLDEYANYYAVTAACATNDLGERAAYSEEGSNLWVCAPSEDDGRQGLTTTQNYNRYDGSTGGTSSAAAVVSGVAALVRKENSDLTWRDVKLILAASARKNDSTDSRWETGAKRYASTSNTETYNYNHQYGFGVVDAKEAVDLTRDWELLPPMRTISGGSADDLDLSIPDTNTAVSDTVTVGAGVDFIEFVEVNAVFDHLSFRDLKMELESPSDTTSVLSVPFTSDENYPLTTSFRFGSARHLGESAMGDWKLRITDSESGTEGTLLSWSITVYGHSDSLASPTITEVSPGSTSLTVAWDVPDGATGITAYDVRHIATTADETVDGNWTVIDDAWTSGDLAETISGLTDGTQYDVQVRAVDTSRDGNWSDTVVGTPGTSATTVPTIGSVRGDDKAIFMSWSVPTSTTDTVAAYDVRHIRNNAASRTDSDWTVEDDAWTSGGGDLWHVITGLDNGVMYDVQVRAVTTSDGAWSPAFSTTTSDHGDALDTATDIVLDTTSNGRIQPLGHNRFWGQLEDGGDSDYFKFELTATQVGSGAGFWLYTTSDLDTVGALLDNNGLVIEGNDQGRVLPNPSDFFMWRTLKAGTYYLKISGYEGAQGPYTLRLRTFTDTTSRGNAVDLPLDGSASGMLDPKGDEDYFKLVVPTDDTEIVLRSSGFLDSVGELQNSSGTSLHVNDDGYLTDGLRRQFLIRTSLDTGTYYLKAKGFDSFIFENTGPFSVYATTLTEPGSTTTDAQALTLGRAAGGVIDPGSDTDYYSITLAEPTYVYIRAVSDDDLDGNGDSIDLDGELLDSDSNAITPDSAQDSGGDVGFTIRDRLDAGTYYIKVTGDSGTDTGRYTIMASEEFRFSRLVDECSAISRSSGINDELYGCQWHLNNDAQFRGGARKDINVEDVWSNYDGTGITVAVVDDGMQYDHEDLTDNKDTSKNHDYTGSGEIYDPLKNHGTAVAGIIAARDNIEGMRGVAPRATIYGYNLLLSNEDKDEGDAMSRNHLTTAISNNSWGPGDSGGPEPTNSFWINGVQKGITDGFHGKGTFYVWAAGNGARYGDYSNLDEYANYYAVTAACAVNHQDVRSSYSEPGSNLWVCAPSNDGGFSSQPGIATTDNGNRYRDDFGGTSAAAPIVSGVAALVRDANEDLTWRDVKLILAASARKNDPTDSGWEEGALKYSSNTESYNFNHQYGFGVVDAKVAVDLAGSWTNAPTFRQISGSYDVNRTLPDAHGTLPGRTVTSSITLGPSVEFVEFIEVELDIDHTSIRDLDIELVSPSGAVSVMVPHDEYGRRSWTGEFRFGSARHLGEDAKGEWTLRITDRVPADLGSLKSWELTAYGHGYVPTGPDIDGVTPTQGALTITWKEPDAGASSITQYDLRYVRSDVAYKPEDQWTVVEDVGTAGSDLSHTLPDLDGGVDYDIQVRAVNGRGLGPWSDTVKTQFPVAAPTAPSITSITPGDARLAVSWTAPTENGGEDPASYDVRRIETSATDKADDQWTVVTRAWTRGGLQYTITSLTNATEYDVQVRATNSGGSSDWSATITGTPERHHTPVTLSVESSTISVSEDGGTATATVFLTTTIDQAPRSDFSVDVTVTVAENGATQSTDFGSPSASTITFAAADFVQTTVSGQQRHQASEDVTIDIIDDAIDEDDEQLILTLAYGTSGLPHLRGGSPTVRITITDNDHVPVTLDWQNATRLVNEGVGTVTLRALAITTKDKRPDTGFSFNATVSTSEGTAEQPADYTHLSQTVTFQQTDFRRATVGGQSRYLAEKQVSLSIIDDSIDEPEEDFTVTISYLNPSLTHLQGGPATTTLNVTDNDHVPVTIEWEQAAHTVGEGDGTVKLIAYSTTAKDKAPESGFSFAVRVTTTAGSATQNSDYRAFSRSETFRQADFAHEDVNGQMRYRAEKEFDITISEDTIDEEDESFTANLAYSASPLPSHLTGAGDTATVTIIDNDHVPVTLGWEQEAVTVGEPLNSGDTTEETLTLFATTTKDKMPENGLTFDVTVSTANGSARQPGDYTQVSETLTFTQADFFPATVNGQQRYQAEKTVTLIIAYDGAVESNETFTISAAYATSAPHLQGSSARATVTITDDLSSTVDLEAVASSVNSVVRREVNLAYTYTVRNHGPASSTNTVLTVTLDRGVSFVQAADPDKCNHSGVSRGGAVTCVLGILDASGEENGSILAQASPTASMDFTSNFSVSSNQLDQEPGNNSVSVFVELGAPPEKITSLRASSAGNDFIELSWTPPVDNGSSVTGYELDRKDDTDVYLPVSPPPGAAVAAYRDESVTTGSSYTYRLRSINEDGEAEWSNEVTAKAEVRVTIITTGGGGGGGGGAPANRPPRIRGEDRPTYAENGTGPVVTYTVEDPDTDDQITWSLEGRDSGHMEISQAGVLSFKEPPDYEEPVDSRFDNTYEVTLRATDDGSPPEDDIHRVRVTVTNVNEAPLITGPGTVEYEENGADLVASYMATDPEGVEVVSWVLAGDDAGQFSISDDGVLTLNDSPDYEAPQDADGNNVYRVTVQATDTSDLTGALEVEVTVTDVDDGGIVARYDTDGDGLIERDEALQAVVDYFADVITKDEAVEVIAQYFIS